jgi:succinoglycan biosynthesis protein ExoA
MKIENQITVVCPVLNESSYLPGLVDFFLNAKPVNKELVFIDGGSTDGTREMIQKYSALHSQIKLVDNPKKFVPHGLNLAIASTQGDPVVRLDAHTVYSPDYFEAVINSFTKTGTDITGGPMRAVGKTSFQKAVAIATGTVFGIGDSSFHDENKEGYVDSVYLGAWRRRIFAVTGLFDVDMLRNQDDEFHYRAKSRGMKIYLDPEIKSWYYPRKTPSSLFKQYYQYGLFKPLVLRKVKSGMRIRHLIPSAFVLYLISLPLSLLFLPWLIPFFIYILLDILFSFKYGESITVSIKMLIVYPILHFSYGSGFLKGLWTLMKGKIPAI